MTDIQNMTPRELGRGLMRGNARELKAGYSSANAWRAVCELRGIDTASPEAGELALYLRGFARGMAGLECEAEFAGTAARDGHADGAREPRELIQPAGADQ